MIECPYCNQEIEDPQECYETETIYEHECEKCGKTFAFTRGVEEGGGAVKPIICWIMVHRKETSSVSISFDPDNFTCGSLATRLGVPYHIARAIVAAGIKAGKVRVVSKSHGNSRRLAFCSGNKLVKEQTMMVIGETGC